MANVVENVAFVVISGHADVPKDMWWVHGQFDSPDAAKVLLSELKEGAPLPAGSGYAMRKVSAVPVPVVDWEAREQDRFDSGRYKAVPWVDEYGGWPEHYAHLAESDLRKIAFTETPAKGLADVQKVLSCSDYLARYYGGDMRAASGCEPYMTSSRRETYLAEVICGEYDLHITSTTAEMVEVYESLGSDASRCGSCMGYSTAHFGTPVHPVAVYGDGGDLKLAVMRDIGGVSGFAAGTVLARCLVWPEHSLWGRVYARQGFSGSMVKALKAAGYTRGGSDSLTGAALAVIPNPDQGQDCYVMPYIDGSCAFEGDAENGFAISGSYEGSHKADSTSGIAYLGPQHDTNCERCDDGFNSEDEGTHVTLGGDSEHWCDRCVERHASSCEECNDYVPDDSIIAVEAGGGHRYSRSICGSCACDDYIETSDGTWLHSEDCGSCDDCSDTFRASDLVPRGEDAVYCVDCAPDEEDEDAEDDAPRDDNAAVGDLLDMLPVIDEAAPVSTYVGLSAIPPALHSYYCECDPCQTARAHLRVLEAA